MMMLLSAVLAAVKNDMFYRQCRRKPETKKRQSTQLRKLTLCERETVIFPKKTLKLTKKSIAQF
jgi:hypothetical protein